MTNILIVNQHSKNFGDDAAGCALVQELLKKESVSRIDIIYNCNVAIPINNPKVFHHLELNFDNMKKYNLVKYYFLHKRIGIRPQNEFLKKWIDIIDSSDFIFMSPCGANIGIYKDWASLARLFMITKHHKKIIFHYNTIGKSGNMVFDLLAKKVLSKSLIYVREKKSLNYINSIGMNGYWGPDTAYLLEKIKVNTKINVITLVPSFFDDWHPEFKNNPIDSTIQSRILPQIARWAENNGYFIEIIPHLNTEEEIEYNQKVKDILNLYCNERAKIRDDILTVWDYDKNIASSSIVIGMRYHAIVLASKNNVPFLSLSYENKMKEVCKYTNMENYQVDLHSKDEFERVSKILTEIKNNRDEIVKNLEKKTKSFSHICTKPTEMIE